MDFKTKRQMVKARRAKRLTVEKLAQVIMTAILSVISAVAILLGTTIAVLLIPAIPVLYWKAVGEDNPLLDKFK